MVAGVPVSVLLIDGENIPAKYIGGIMRHVGKAAPAQSRVYGDFSAGVLQGWRDHSLTHALRLFQTSGKAGGKNNADILLTIDAMDLMASEGHRHFCLVSNDGDFAPLAVRLRQAGRIVTGIGTHLAHANFRAACDAFHALDEVAPDVATKAVSAKPAVALSAPADISLLFRAVRKELPVDADGWVHGGRLGSLIMKKYPGITWSDYGSGKFKALFKAHEDFEISERSSQGFYVRLRGKAGDVVPLRMPA